MSNVHDDQRRKLIAETAYHIAERRGFAGGDPVADWLEAEAEVDARLHRGLDDWLTAAHDKLELFKRKLAELASEAREEWAQDLDKLGKLQEAFRRRVEEIRQQGGEAGTAAKQQAEKIRDEISHGIERMTMRRRRRAAKEPAEQVAE